MTCKAQNKNRQIRCSNERKKKNIKVRLNASQYLIKTMVELKKGKKKKFKLKETTKGQ